MADPFEVRLRFTNLLSHLSASATACIKTAHYALKHRDMDEDLHSCILENLERNNMNNRANIMYFLEHFCDMATKEGHENYVDMVRRDIARIVSAAVGGPGVGGANVKVVRKVVGDLGAKGVLGEEILRKIEEGLKGKEDERRGGLLSDGDVEGEKIEGDEDDDAKEDDQEMFDLPAMEEAIDTAEKNGNAESQRVTPRTASAGKSQNTKTNGMQKVDKRFIEQRIEEDRERNKRLRESVWAVGGEDGEELDKMWDEGSDVGEHDRILAEEETEERRQFSRYHQNQLDT